MAKQYHIQCTESDVAPYVLLPGDPHRVEKVAKLMDNAHFVAENREHVTWTGLYKGMPVTCTSTGMGCPSTAIAIEELARCGAKTFLRMGTCLGIADNVQMGDVVIFDSACRFEGTTRCYAPIEYPAVADHQVVEGCISASKRLNVPYHVGTSRCIDGCFTNRPEKTTSFGGYRLHAWDDFVDDLRAMKVIAGEMESSAVMVLSRLFGLRGGALCICLAHMFKQNEGKKENLDFNTISYNNDFIARLNKIALESLYAIFENDMKELVDK